MKSLCNLKYSAIQVENMIDTTYKSDLKQTEFSQKWQESLLNAEYTVEQFAECVLSLNNYLNAGLNNVCLLQGPSEPLM